MKGGTTRWMSPELLDPDQFGSGDGRPTKESDCYALGMVIYEVLSGQVPFAPDKDLIVMRKVIEGERPGRPQREGALFTDDLWRTLELCWATRRESRPRIEAALECLGQASLPFPTMDPSMDDSAEMGTDGELGSTPNQTCMFPNSAKISGSSSILLLQ